MAGKSRWLIFGCRNNYPLPLTIPKQIKDAIFLYDLRRWPKFNSVRFLFR
jgi:hypothetical protein